MRLSRMPVPLTILLAAGSPAVAQRSITAEEALQDYREKFKPIAQIDCPPSADPNEITVCGRRSEQGPYRLPLPSERQPGEPEHLVRGEVPRASSTIDGCLRLCQRMVGVSVTAAKF